MEHSTCNKLNKEQYCTISLLLFSFFLLYDLMSTATMKRTRIHYPLPCIHFLVLKVNHSATTSYTGNEQTTFTTVAKFHQCIMIDKLLNKFENNQRATTSWILVHLQQFITNKRFLELYVASEDVIHIEKLQGSCSWAYKW